MPIRDYWRQFRSAFSGFHPLRKAFYYIAFIVGPLTVLAFLLGWGNKSLNDEINDFIKHENFWLMLYWVGIRAPIQEEIIFRGPAFLAFISGWLAIKFFHWRGVQRIFLEKKLILGLTVLEFLVWPLIIVPAYFWAAMHPYAVPTFVSGLILGWLMIRTKNILYPIILHSAINILVLIGLKFGLRIIG
ncbi:MAG: CPBP family intramembrane glutamic endopeptidase [Patescibacteria group bacterium]